MYATMKEETVWSFDRLQSYINEKYATEKGLPENWVYTAFTVRLHRRLLRRGCRLVLPSLPPSTVEDSCLKLPM